MTGIEKFEAAIIEFGAKAALEYFATPKDKHYLWAGMLKMEARLSEVEEPKTGRECEYSHQTFDLDGIMIYSTSCGNMLDIDGRNCAHCGKPIRLKESETQEEGGV